MACHRTPPFADEQIAWIDERIRAAMAQVRHCGLCGTQPVGRVTACVETDCPARVAVAA